MERIYGELYGSSNSDEDDSEENPTSFGFTFEDEGHRENRHFWFNLLFSPLLYVLKFTFKIVPTLLSKAAFCYPDSSSSLVESSVSSEQHDEDELPNVTVTMQLSGAPSLFQYYAISNNLDGLMSLLKMSIGLNRDRAHDNIVLECLDSIRDASEDDLELRNKIDFFNDMSAKLGRTALCLSGGGNLTLCHIGVVEYLYENNLLPSIVSGSSAGAIIAAVLFFDKLSQEKMKSYPKYAKMNYFKLTGKKYSFFSVIKSMFRKGAVYDIHNLAKVIRNMIGDVTFLEAFKRSKTVLNITASPKNRLEGLGLFNYLTSPDVLIWSAVAASCSLPLIFNSFMIIEKTPHGDFIPWNVPGDFWIDGSVVGDIPLYRISELFNVNQFIVSQANPHIIPFLISPKYLKWVKTPYKFIQNFIFKEIKHQTKQAIKAGIFPSFFTELDKILKQDYQADINIVPEFSSKDFFNLFGNPSEQIIETYRSMGYLATKKEHKIISERCRMEIKIERTLKELSKKETWMKAQEEE